MNILEAKTPCNIEAAENAVKEHIETRIAEYQKRYNTDYHLEITKCPFTIACFMENEATGKRGFVFNQAALLQFKPEIIDLVIAHEYAHALQIEQYGWGTEEHGDEFYDCLCKLSNGEYNFMDRFDELLFAEDKEYASAVKSVYLEVTGTTVFLAGLN